MTLREGKRNMLPRLARTAQYRGQVEYRDEATSLVTEPGDLVLVVRGRPRSVVIGCPDGCGEVLTVNLDPCQRLWILPDCGH